MPYYRHMPEKRQTLISTNEVAELIGKDPRTVQRMAANGDLPATKMPGKRGAFIFDRTSVLNALAKATPSTPSSGVPSPQGPGEGVTSVSGGR